MRLKASRNRGNGTHGPGKFGPKADQIDTCQTMITGRWPFLIRSVPVSRGHLLEIGQESAPLTPVNGALQTLVQFRERDLGVIGGSDRPNTGGIRALDWTL